MMKSVWRTLAVSGCLLHVYGEHIQDVAARPRAPLGTGAGYKNKKKVGVAMNPNWIPENMVGFLDSDVSCGMKIRRKLETLEAMPEETKELVASMAVIMAMGQGTETDVYDMNHSAWLFLLGDGRWVTIEKDAAYLEANGNAKNFTYLKGADGIGKTETEALLTAINRETGFEWWWAEKQPQCMEVVNKAKCKTLRQAWFLNNGEYNLLQNNCHHMTGKIALICHQKNLAQSRSDDPYAQSRDVRYRRQRQRFPRKNATRCCTNRRTSLTFTPKPTKKRVRDEQGH